LKYLALAKDDAGSDLLKSALAEVDAAVLRLYQLPIDIETALLELFRGFPRVGVPFRQDCYIPAELLDRVAFGDFVTFERDWPTTNQLRGGLINKKIAVTLTNEERELLNALQDYADYYLDRTTPPDLTTIHEIQQRLASALQGE
jgi:hypothetical protein